MAIAAFPAVASAAPPAAAACPNPAPTTGVPCYTAAPSYTPSGEAPAEGRILTGTVGTWGGAQLVNTNTTEWDRCSSPISCTKISSARTYTITSADVGSTLEFIVTASNTAGSVVYTETVGVVSLGTPLDRVAPSQSGVPQDGQVLTASAGVWAGTQPITYEYQWKRCPADGNLTLCGAAFTALSSSQMYTIQDADVGHTLCVVVQATNNAGPGGTPASVTKGCPIATAVITPRNIAPPTISGTPQQGQTLSLSQGTWAPGAATLSDQWQRCDASGSNCSPIPGATSQSYTLTSSDVSQTIGVKESATDNGATSSTTVVTGVVQGPPAAPPSPPGNNGGNTGNNGGKSGGQTGSQTGGQTGGKGSPPPPPTVNSAQLRALLMNALALHGKGERIRALLKNGGYVFSFTAPSSGRLVISWYRTKHGKKILVASATFAFQKTGTARIALVLTGKGRNLLKGAGNMKLTASADFTPAGQGTISATRLLTLKS